MTESARWDDTRLDGPFNCAPTGCRGRPDPAALRGPPDSPA